ncbi:MAG: hypothetical protein AAFZ52_13260, partial [Bacteroidota bacterium]
MITKGQLLALLFALGTAAVYAQGLPTDNEIWRARDYTTQRASSYDRTGANDDGNWKDKIKPGETRTIAEMEGPGIIKHMWM